MDPADVRLELNVYTRKLVPTIRGFPVHKEKVLQFIHKIKNYSGKNVKVYDRFGSRWNSPRGFAYESKADQGPIFPVQLLDIQRDCKVPLLRNLSTWMELWKTIATKNSITLEWITFGSDGRPDGNGGANCGYESGRTKKFKGNLKAINAAVLNRREMKIKVL
jgi:hypothetical protein